MASDIRDLVVSEKKALELLEVKKGTFRKLLTMWGVLPTKGPPGSEGRHYYQSQILEMRDNKEFLPGHSIVDRINILAARQQTLFRQVRQIAEATGLVHLETDITDSMLVNLYESAVSSTGTYLKKRPTQSFLDSWLTAVPLLTEQEFQRLAGIYKGDPHPWRVFYRLTDELIISLNLHLDMNIDREFERYRTRLILCLDRIRFSARTFILLDNPRADPTTALAHLLQIPGPGSPETQLDRNIEELRTEEIDPQKAIQNLLDSATAEEVRSMARRPLDLRGSGDRPPPHPPSGE